MTSIHRFTVLPAFLLLVMLLGMVGCDQQNSSDSAERSGQAKRGDAATAAGHADDHGTLATATSDAGHGKVDGHAESEWCEEHQISESECVFCNPELMESMGWCGGHQVPEALCYQCNPNLVAAFKALGDWCAEHDRPESQCYICNPELEPGYDAGALATTSAAAADSGTADFGSTPTTDPTDSIPRTQRKPAVFCTKQSLTVSFAREEIADQAGLGFAAVQELPITHTLECNATVAYDGNRYAQLAPQVSGIVETVEKDLGDTVEAGEVLATITSPAFGAAKAAYLQAATAVELWRKNQSRERDLLAKGVGTERDVLEAESNLAESRIKRSRAEQELFGLGLTSSQIEQVARSGDTTSRYPVTASFSGVVVDRQAAVGEVFDPSQPLFAVADISRMWALLDVYESDIRQIQMDQPVVLYVEGLRGESFAGRITWVSSRLEPRTRTLRARAELDNSSGMLRANMFARAVVAVRDRQPTLVVPKEAVQWEGCCNVVFVKQSKTSYKPRRVYLGPASGSFYEVRSGVKQGDVVVTQGSFLLKTEILKTNIGAGCCEATPGS